MQPDGSHFILESSAYFGGIKMRLIICHTPFWKGQHAVTNLHDSNQSCLTPNTTVTLIEQSHNIQCKAAYYNLKKKLVYESFKNEVRIDKSTEIRTDDTTV